MFGVESTEAVAAQSGGEGASPATRRMASNCLQKDTISVSLGVTLCSKSLSHMAAGSPVKN